MKFCSHCGHTVHQAIPEGDSKLRYVCASCGTIHYQNPLVVVGTLPVWQDKILLCRRAIEPRQGFWTLPAGFMENDETLDEGAARETLEEANAPLTDMQIYTVMDVTHVNQVHVFFRASLADGSFSPGPESIDVELFAENEIPWNELAFATVFHTLECFLNDRRTGAFPLHNVDIKTTTAFEKVRRLRAGT